MRRPGSARIHPKGALSGWGQDSVQTSQIYPHKTLSFMSLWIMWYALVHSHVGRGASDKLFQKFGRMEFSKMSWYAEALNSFHWNYGAKLSSWKTTAYHNSPSDKLYAWHNAVLTNIILLATTKPKLIHQISRWRSVVCHSGERVFTVLGSSSVILYTTALDPLHCIWWCMA